MSTSIFDAHMHIYSYNPENALGILDACNIAKGVIMNKGYDREQPNLSHAAWEEAGFRILEKYPDRFAIFSTVDFSGMDEEDFASRAANDFEASVRRGVSGLKLWLGKPDHHWMALHDPRIGAVYIRAADLGVPVLIHVGDPEEYWQGVTPSSFWYAVLKDNPQWSFQGQDVASREQLFEEQVNMLELYPETTFICPHMGGHAENLDYLGELLDRFSNLYVDTAAYEPLLGQTPETTRAFFIKYQDRILVGTDNGWNDEGLAVFKQRMNALRRFYETRDEQTNLDNFLPRRPGYSMVGIGLPQTVLSKIYRLNITRLVPSLSDA